MTTVEVVGAGAVAQLLCRELLAAKAQVMLHVPQGARSDQQHHQLTAELKALPWMQGLMANLAGSPSLRLFAGTPEQFWSYQTSHHHQIAGSPVLLLTSWWDTLSALRRQLQGPVLPCYPRVTVESWQGRLAVVGRLQLEIPNDFDCPMADWTAVGEALDACGLAWELRPMQHRFKAHFARTCFAYWYLVANLEAAERGENPVDRQGIEAEWQRLQPLLDHEPDLKLPLEMLEFAIALMRQGQPQSSDPAWILEILLHHKRAKIDYFLQRQHQLF
jgi:hypothetical protein